jgi:hypothetical protein
LEVLKLKEEGYKEAVLGFSLSYRSTLERTESILAKYAFGKSGENKFLESIYIWLDVNAPRFWWSEADTYRLSTKQSESTMHFLCKQHLTQNNFEYSIEYDYLDFLNNRIDLYKEKIISIAEVKNALPEGYLQRRIWCMNYKCFRNIYEQRITHRLPQWQFFCNIVLRSLEHPEFILQNYDKEKT